MRLGMKTKFKRLSGGIRAVYNMVSKETRNASWAIKA
jgi:hypothetical protein